MLNSGKNKRDEECPLGAEETRSEEMMGLQLSSCSSNSPKKSDGDDGKVEARTGGIGTAEESDEQRKWGLDGDRRRGEGCSGITHDKI